MIKWMQASTHKGSEKKVQEHPLCEKIWSRSSVNDSSIRDQPLISFRGRERERERGRRRRANGSRGLMSHAVSAASTSGSATAWSLARREEPLLPPPSSLSTNGHSLMTNIGPRGNI